MNTQILDKTACVHIVCSIWSGRRRLHADDLDVDHDQLPPEDLASLGSLKLCDPSSLQRLNVLKRGAERACRRVCVRFLGGYATNLATLEELVVKLEKVKKAFDIEAAQFVSSFQRAIDEWIGQHPQWEEAIRKKLPDLTYICHRLSFNYQVYQVKPTTTATTSAPQLLTADQTLSNQLFSEIAQDATLAWKTSYEGRTEVGQKALRPIRTLREKLTALRYLDQRVGPIIAQIDSVLGAVPKQGPIAAQDFMAVAGVLTLLRQPAAMASHGAKFLERSTAPQASPPPALDDAPDTPAEAEPSTEAAPPPQTEPPSLWFLPTKGRGRTGDAL